MSGRRHQRSPAGPAVPPAGDTFTPDRIEQAKRLTAALAIAAEEGRSAALVQLARRVAQGDRRLAEVVILNLAEAVRLAVAGG